MPVPSRRELTADLAREVVERVAPQELPRFSATSDAYFASGERVSRAEGDDMLGFGGTEVVTFVTPIVLAAVTRAIDFASEPAKESVQSGISALIAAFVRWLKRKIGRKEERVGRVQPLTQEQLLRARTVVLQTLGQHAFPADKQELVADVLIGKLAMVGSERQG